MAMVGCGPVSQALMRAGPRRTFNVQAEWDEEARVWWAHNGDIPLATEAKTFDSLVKRVMQAAPELIVANRIAKLGQTVMIQVKGERATDVLLTATGASPGSASR